MDRFRNQGFTVIELIVVIVVIVILSAISMVSYRHISDSANESAIDSDLANFARLVEIYRIKNGRYPAPNTPAELEAIGFKASQQAYPRDISWNFDYCSNTPTGNTKYILVVKLSPTKAVYVSNNNTAPKKYVSTEGFPDSNIDRSSPCYNDVLGSAADNAGLSGIARIISPNPTNGVSGKNPTQWNSWTK